MNKLRQMCNLRGTVKLLQTEVYINRRN